MNFQHTYSKTEFNQSINQKINQLNKFLSVVEFKKKLLCAGQSYVVIATAFIGFKRCAR